MLFSIIIPVYNRPDETRELLAGLSLQTCKDFEVIIVEDGSADTCASVVEDYASLLNIQYFYKTNSGPGLTRNYGAGKSGGDYLIFLDSDCLTPAGYIQAIETELNRQAADAFGGPDRAHASFTRTQKAINYSMTSFLTTGGIRGGNKRIDRFYPRSFNMGIKRDVFDQLGGFADMRFGEDLDLSYRIAENGYNSRLFPDAWVYHKRRTNFRKFFKQVFNSGIARIVLTKKHPGTLKPVHALPAAFTIGCSIVLILSVFCPLLLALFLLFVVLIFADASVRTKSMAIGALAVVASFIQLTGYGSGFIAGWWKICVRRRQKYAAFTKGFYK